MTVSASRLQTVFTGDFITAHKTPASVSQTISWNKSLDPALVHFHLVKCVLGQIGPSGWETGPCLWFILAWGRAATFSVRNLGVCCANSVSKWQQQSNLPALVHTVNWLCFHTGNGNGAASFTCAVVGDEIRRRDAESCSVDLETYFEGLSTRNVFVKCSNSSNTAKITSITTEPSGNMSLN